MNKLRLVPALLAAVFLSGCIGAGLLRETGNSIESEKGFVMVGKDIHPIDPHQKTSQEPVTEKILVSIFGQPDKTFASDSGTKILRYNEDLSWRGVVLFVGIPIPLALPVGRNHQEFYFKDGLLVEHHWFRGWLRNFAGCNISLECWYVDTYEL